MLYRAVKSGLCSIVNTAIVVPGYDTSLSCIPRMDPRVTPPAFCTAQVEINPHFTHKARDEAFLTTYVFTGTVESDEAQGKLDDYLSKSGNTSIRAALLAYCGSRASAVGGNVELMTIQRIEAYRAYDLDPAPLFGAQIVLRLIGSTA